MAEERAGKRIKTHDRASSSSTPPGSEYQVFLSFRGVDTRKAFADHLFCHLTGAGIRTFRDKEELRVGKEIRSDLLKAIVESTISIPIFSKGYASSEWCLMELTQMVKCMNNNNGHTIWPIFYDVTPSDVRHQTQSFAEAFLQHTEKFDEPIVQEWKEALKQVADLKGWEKDKFEDGHEGKLVDKIVTEVCMMLKKSHVSLTGDLVGMDHHIEEMAQKLDINNGNGVWIVGIIGMGGIGKTTIAKFMYNQLCDHFQRQCSFLEDVRENVVRYGCAELQKQLISALLKLPADGINIRNAFRHKKVLIVLDDVEDKSQLTKIIGDREYFGPGSRIIVTTRNKDVFEEWKGDLIYEPSVMDIDESLLLFYKYAFKSNQPREGYEVISREVVSTAAGLPLSLVVIGSLLFNKEQTIWEAALQKLKEVPADDVQKRLKISYDTLSKNQKQMFLDIACHFIGEDKTNAIYMWKHCEFSPEFEGIDVLVSLSLITIEKLQYSGDVFRMHDQLRDLGRHIVYQENPSDFGKRSRIWSNKEAEEVLNNRSETKKVQTLHIKFDDDFRGRFSNHDFKGMSNLRYLHLYHPWHLKEDFNLEGDLEGDFNRLLPQLRWFSCRLTGIAVTNFCPRKLVILNLSRSTISDVHWESLWKQMERTLSNLKVLDLSFCRGLRKTPDFSKFCNLERLILACCRNLTEIGSSAQHLKSLTYFNANYCNSLRELPPEFGSMAALQEVYLDNSPNFEMENKIGITELPESIGQLTQLRCLSLMNCESLREIPESFGNLKSLVILNCFGCRSLEGAFPSGIGRLTSLRVLNLSSTQIDTLPDDIGSLCNLRELYLSSTRIKKLPGIGQLTQLRCLSLWDCKSLREIPESFGNLKSLVELDCSRCFALKGAVPSGIGKLSSLRVLNFSDTQIDTLPDDIGSLCNLRELNLSSTRIKKLPGIGQLTQLECLLLRNCFSLREIPESFGNLKSLVELDCSWCFALKGAVPSGIGKLSSLRVLRLSYTKIDTLPEDIGSLCNLRELNLRSTCIKKLPGVGIEMLQKLELLDCSGCESLEGPLPEGIWSLSSLRILIFENCRKITGGLPKDISGMSRLEGLDLGNCENLRLPTEGLKLPLSLTGLVIPYTKATLESLRSLVNLRFLDFNIPTEFPKGHCCDPHRNNNNNGTPSLPTIDMPSNLEDLRLIGFDDHVMSCLLSAMKFDSSSRLKRLGIKNFKDVSITGWLYLSNCQMLESLEIKYCYELREIADWGKLGSSWVSIGIWGCDSLEVLPNLSTMKRLKNLKIELCRKLREIKGLEVLTSLEQLEISGFPLLKVLPNFSSMKRLKNLKIELCRKLREIKGLEVLTSLEQLEISFLPLLKVLPNFSSMKRLKMLNIGWCPELREIKGLEVLTSLKELTIRYCPHLKKDELHPDLLNSEKLKIIFRKSTWEWMISL